MPNTQADGGSATSPRRRRLLVNVLLMGADIAAVEAAIWLVAASMAAFHLSTGAAPATGPALPDFVRAFATAAPLLVILGLCFRLYESNGLEPFDRFRLRVRVALLFFGAGAIVGALVPALLPQLLFFVPVAALVTILLGCWVETALRHALVRRSMWAAPVVVLGCGATSRSLAAKLLAQPELGLRPIGYLDDGEATEGRGDVRCSGDDGRLPILGLLADAPRLAATGCGAIAPQVVAARIAAIGMIADLAFHHLVIVPDVVTPQTMGIGVRSLGDVVGLEVHRGLAPAPRRWLKRGLDIAVAGPLLMLALPVIVLMALAIKLVSPGKAFYTQRRVGLRGVPLLVPKLRSMYPDAERRLRDHLATDPAASAEWERYVKLSSDPRVLPIVGAFIRRASLDELPQLWNIVCGGMSLVGPRPFPSYHVDRFDADFQALRTSVPPGLTGLWQVTSRSDGDLEKQKEQDSFYIRNWSLLLDLYILAQTLPAVLFAKGAK